MKKPIPFGKYLLLERINVGGMAEVFLGKAFGVEGFERLLAIKRILPTMVEDTEFITMFLDEARISVQLNHANVVQIYELGKHDDSYYIAMEYVSGKDLRHLLEYYRKQRSVMPTAMAAFIASKICEGLEYAHRKKDARGMELHIVHRDVSPQNILLSYEGEAKLIDFGIAKAANRAQKTQAGILKGKFGYMSPEQVRGLPIDHRSDLFAVGVILYEMLTGERLFVGESDFSTLEKVRNADVLPPRQFNTEIPPGLEKVVLKALAREVEDRYQWCSDMQEDLMRYLLSGDTIYSPKHLASFMKEAFSDDQNAEQERLEKYASVARPDMVEVSGVTASSGNSGPNVMPEQRAPEPEPEPEPEPPPPPKRRPTRAPIAPPRQQEELDSNATLMGVDPYNPIIPPPEPGELDDEPPADRTEIFQPEPEPSAKKAPQRKPTRAAAPALGDDHEVTATPAAGPSAKQSKRMSTRLPKSQPIIEPPPEPEPEEPEPSEEEDNGEGEVVKTVIGVPAPKRPNGQVKPARPAPRRPEPEPEEQEEEDGPATAPPEDEGYDEGQEEEPQEEEQVEDPNATVMRMAPAVQPRRPTAQRPVPRPSQPPPPRLTGSKQPVSRPPPVVGKPQSKPPVKKGTSKLALIFVSVGALLLVLIVAAAVLFKPPATGTLVVKVAAKEAEITVDKKLTVKAGAPVALPAGPHTVVVAAAGFKPFKKSIEVQAGQKTALPVELEPDEAAKPEKPDEPAPDKPAEPTKPEDPKVAAGDGKKPDEPAKPDKVGDGKKPPEEPKKPPEEPKKPADPKVATNDGKKPPPEEPKKPPPEAAKPALPDLKVESTPTGADIEINGKKSGRTPTTIKAIDPAKVKSITVTLKGYKRDTKPVEWDGVAKIVAVFFSLEKAEEPKPPPETATNTKDPKKPADTKKPDQPAKEPKPSNKPMGKLLTSSNPIAKISIDGKDTGRWTPTPPAQPIDVQAGSHTVTYTASDGRTATRQVTIIANETAKVIKVDDFK